MPGRVLFISPQPFFQWRGSPIRVAFDVQALAESGYAVDLLTLPVGEDRPIPGVRVIRVPNVLRVKDVKIGPSAAKLVFDLLLLLKGLSLCMRNRYDVIHGIEDAGVVAWLLCAATHAHLVFEKHSDPSSYNKGRLKNAVMAMYAGVERFVMRRADATIGTGPGLADQVRSVSGVRAVYHIPDLPSSLVVADEAGVVRYRASFERTPDDVVILYVGSFAVYQGVDLMFTAIPAVCRQFPGARFVIYGGSERDIAQRRAELAAQGCADAVLFAGRISPDELPHALAAADVLLSPRLSGVNTPLKILDYMKAGRAIVATDTPANRLLLDESRAFMSAADPDSFAEMIVNACRDGEGRVVVAAEGLELVRTTYSFESFKNRLEACYREVMEA